MAFLAEKAMSTVRVRRAFVWGFFLFLLAGPSQAANSARTQTIAMEFCGGPDISGMTGYGNCQWLDPLDEPNETLTTQPDYKSDRPYYYAARYGDAEDNLYTFVLDESGGPGKGYDLVYADINNDNRIDAATEKFPFKLGTTSQADPVKITLTVSSGGKSFPYAFDFTAFPYQDENHPVEKIHANCRDSSIMVGQATFDGHQYKIAIADLDSNGLFNNPEQSLFHGDRFFVDFNGDNSFLDAGGSDAESFSYGRYIEIADKWYAVKITPDGHSVEIAPAQPTLGTVVAPRGVAKVTLISSEQPLHLDFSSGPVKAIVGSYRLTSVTLTRTDAQDHNWTATGSLDEKKTVAVNIEPDDATELPEMLPLTVSIEPAGAAPFEEISLSSKITNACGATFRTPREEGEPKGGFEIQDADGRVVASASFEYG